MSADIGKINSFLDSKLRGMAVSIRRYLIEHANPQKGDVTAQESLLQSQARYIGKRTATSSVAAIATTTTDEGPIDYGKITSPADMYAECPELRNITSDRFERLVNVAREPHGFRSHG